MFLYSKGKFVLNEVRLILFFFIELNIFGAIGLINISRSKIQTFLTNGSVFLIS